MKMRLNNMAKIKFRILPDATFGNVQLSINGTVISHDTYGYYNVPVNSNLTLEALPVKYGAVFNKFAISYPTLHGIDVIDKLENPSEFRPVENEVYRIDVKFRKY
jgi:hypothetical protein